jgi:hypothetical protein
MQRNKLSIFNSFTLPFCAARLIGRHFVLRNIEDTGWLWLCSKVDSRRRFGIPAGSARRLRVVVRANLNAVRLDFGQSHIDMPQRR